MGLAHNHRGALMVALSMIRPLLTVKDDPHKWNALVIWCFDLIIDEPSIEKEKGN